MAIKIGNKEIGKPHNCFVIAEMGLSHDGSLGSAFSFIKAARESNADAVKFQTHIYDAEGTKEEKFRVNVFPQDNSRRDYWKRTAFTKHQWAELKKASEDLDLVFLSSPFSLEAAELLYDLGIKAWKIGSGETNNIPLLKEMGKFNLPFILSTGMSFEEEINRSIKVIQETGCELILMQCTNLYPCPPEKLGLNIIQEYQKKYDIPIGFSDHSGNIYSGLAAYVLGASVIEVHVTFHKKSFGPDVPASITFEELKNLTEGISFLKKSFESPVEKNISANELVGIRELFTKSVVAKVNMNPGDVISLKDLDFKKPGNGIPADHVDTLIGKKLKNKKNKDDLILKEDIANE